MLSVRSVFRAFSLLLCFALALSLLSAPLPACAEGDDTEDVSQEIVDIVRFTIEPLSYVALMSDGTLRTVGLGRQFEDKVLREVFSWTDLVKVISTDFDLIGLRADGSVVSTMGLHERYEPLEERFNPNNWAGVKDIAFSVQEYYGLTEDGHILVSNDLPDASFGGGLAYLDWSGVKEIAAYAYPESRGLIALCEDGTVLRASDFYAFNHTPTDGIAIASSGYIIACLNRDGTVFVAGPAVSMGETFAAHAEELHDVVQIAVANNALLCRLKDGSVAVCAEDWEDHFPDTADWKNMTDIRIMGMTLVGLRADGHVLTAHCFEGQDYDKALCEELAAWQDIVRIKVHDGSEYFPSYVLGWQSDGTMLAAGIDLSGLD